MANRGIENTKGDIFVPGAAPGSPTEGQVYYDSTDHTLKYRNATVWVTNSGDVSLAAVGSTPSANGASISGQQITLQPADGTHPGVLTATGFTNLGNQSGTNSGDVSIGTFGSTPDAKGMSLSSQVVTAQPADATHPGFISTAAQTFGGVKTVPGIVLTPGSAPGTPSEGQFYQDSSTHIAKFYNGTSWVDCGGGSGGTTMGAFGSTPNANGGTITSGVLYLQPADGTYPGGVTTGAQTFAGTKTFANIVSPTVYNTNGTGASDICVKAGTSVAKASVADLARLFQVSSGIGGTETPSIYILKDGRILGNTGGPEHAELSLNTNSGVNVSSYDDTGDLYSSLGLTSAAGVELASSYCTGETTCIGIGTYTADASVYATAKLLSVFTQGTADFIPYFSVTKTACNTVSSAWVADGDYVHNSTEIRTDGMIARYGRDRSSTVGGQTEHAPVGNNSIASGATSSVITIPYATTSSHILITWLGDHGAARSWVTRAAGSFTVNLSSAAAADTGFSWMVTSFLAPWIAS